MRKNKINRVLFNKILDNSITKHVYLFSIWIISYYLLLFIISFLSYEFYTYLNNYFYRIVLIILGIFLVNIIQKEGDIDYSFGINFFIVSIILHIMGLAIIYYQVIF